MAERSMNKIESAIADVPGIVGLAARRLETGEQIRHRADEVFFTASTFKAPVLVELYRQVDQGIVDPDRRIELTDRLRAPGGGVVKELANGLNPTVHDLSLLMIIISDNTATDLLYDLVGRDRLNRTMQELGLANTRIPMSCRELLYSMYGVETDDIAEGTRLVAEGLVKGKVAADSDGMSEERSDVSTPSDMVRLLELIHGDGVLSAVSREAVLDVLGRQQLNTIIPYYLPRGTKTAHKTGGVTGVRCDVGIVYAPSGAYALALMAKHITDGKGIDRSLARVSQAVYEHFDK
jgi:beta-lactamase class A